MSGSPRFEQLCAAFDAGHPALAVELAKLCLAERPDDPQTLLRYASALRDLARYAGAQAAYERLLELLEPERHALAFRELGQLEEVRSDLAAAEGWYRRAAEARSPQLMRGPLGRRKVISEHRSYGGRSR